MRRRTARFRIYYRLGIAPDASPLALESSAYYGIAIGANIAAWGQSWCAALLARTAKPFFVDPMTYVFAQDPRMVMKDDDMRQSYAHLVDEYGGILPAFAGKKPLRPGDFWKTGRLTASGRQFVDAVLSFEMGGLEKGKSTQLRISDYLEMIGEQPETRELVPEFLVPPYFYGSSPDDDWYRVSFAMAKYAASKHSHVKVVPVICLSDQILRDDTAISRIATDCGAFESVLIWISDLDETRATVPQLVGYGQLVHQLAARGVRPLALYGGFFALTLSTMGLEGMSSGVCYAEWKSISRQATGGGTPIRYYIPGAHSKVVKADAITFYTSNPDEFCKCSICRAALDSTTQGGLGARIAEAFEQFDRSSTGRHFMRIRAHELQIYFRASKAACIRSLEADLRFSERTSAGTLGIPTAQITRWTTALERL